MVYIKGQYRASLLDFRKGKAPNQFPLVLRNPKKPSMNAMVTRMEFFSE